MITTTSTFTEANTMEDFIMAYFIEYPSAGYGTSIKELKAEPIFDNGILQYINYEVTLSRLESCD